MSEGTRDKWQAPTGWGSGGLEQRSLLLGVYVYAIRLQENLLFEY